ncbi:zinc-ribbon domain-containing protein [Megasphaera hominis]|jgi:uncharacterized membrane protein YvbJ|uniref:Zinc-ribbon domain-containing protein n=1 Tax=Megasphaera hominis TaxID=159836 RepID=A0ABR6VJN4_9FIRM|nr:zinc-ribbon domain-containing protein [Megasphaera hominis]MBC3537498.1 zinc-ribbon domain-containing protein [Megasphaera hominis]
MICKKCGTELRDGVRMCPICGTQQVQAPTPTPGTVNDPKIFSKTRVISFLIVLCFIVLGLWKAFGT